MLNYIYIILFISTCCFSASLLARVITNKTGNTKNDKTISHCMVDHNNEHRFCPNCDAKMAPKEPL